MTWVDTIANFPHLGCVPGIGDLLCQNYTAYNSHYISLKSKANAARRKHSYVGITQLITAFISYQNQKQTPPKTSIMIFSLRKHI